MIIITIISDKRKKNSHNRKREISVTWMNEISVYTLEILENSLKRNFDILSEKNNISRDELFEEFFTEGFYDIIIEDID